MKSNQWIQHFTNLIGLHIPSRGDAIYDLYRSIQSKRTKNHQADDAGRYFYITKSEVGWWGVRDLLVQRLLPTDVEYFVVLLDGPESGYLFNR